MTKPMQWPVCPTKIVQRRQYSYDNSVLIFVHYFRQTTNAKQLTWRDNWLASFTFQSKWHNGEKKLGQTNTRAFDPVWKEQKIIFLCPGLTDLQRLSLQMAWLLFFQIWNEFLKLLKNYSKLNEKWLAVELSICSTWSPCRLFRMLFSTFDQMVIVSKIHGQPSYIYIFKIEDPISNGSWPSKCNKWTQTDGRTCWWMDICWIFPL